LVAYLVSLHSAPCDDGVGYERSLRDLFGGGEGIFGIVDGYGNGAPGVDVARLKRLEQLCLDWRWRLKARRSRPARIHADFHPFNVLFDEQSSLHVLDTSRGSLGNRADDVTCMAVNYVFFALENAATWQAAFARLWYDFWNLYQRTSGDADLLAIAPPYLTWRLLVLACPAWYPNLSEPARSRLLNFAEATLQVERFEPNLAELVFR
jgi:aminoglycoside phosphotransferase (APT) family kinase protein